MRPSIQAPASETIPPSAPPAQVEAQATPAQPAWSL
jgi:hypothetical protein